MRRLVILRPEPGASATFDKARALGLDPVRLPLFEIEPLDWAPPSDLSQFDGILFTSANAIRHVGKAASDLRSLPVYAVGAATAKSASDAGFQIAHQGSSNLAELLQSIGPDLRLLHLAGEDRVDPGPVEQSITVLPVYRARAIPEVDASAIRGSVVLIHSPRAGKRLAEIAGDRATIAIAAISAAAARACGEGWEEVAFVDRPDDAALLALAARLCEKSSE